MKVIFMGTPEFSVPVLEKLITNYEVVLVVSQPDKRVGRKKELVNTPIKEVALKNNIEVFQPVSIREEYQKILDTECDIIITCAYGQIIPEVLINYPRLGCINVHASLLPKLRGGAPIHHAIIDGYQKSGITIMYMDKLMDNGDIISQNETFIEDTDTYTTLHDKLSNIGSDLLIKTLPSIINQTNKREKQNLDEVTFGYNIKREEEQINFNRLSKDVFNQIRGLSLIPGAYTLLDNKVLKVYESYISDLSTKDIRPGTITNIYKNGIGVATIDYEIVITKVKPVGKNIMDAKDYINGINKKNTLGRVLSNEEA